MVVHLCIHFYFWLSFIALLFTNFVPGAEFFAFFSFSTFVLLYGLWLYHVRASKRKNIESPLGFAQSSIARNPSRSLLCIGLIAATTFLVLSISAFRLDPSTDLWNSSGSFIFIGETTFPVHHNIATIQGREGLAIQPDDETYLKQNNINIVAFRMGGGDNSSCLNLFQTGNPRILGVPTTITERPHFSFAQSANPYTGTMGKWKVLYQPITVDPDGVRRVPVIIDANTAMYALHIHGGIGAVYELDDGANGIIRCEVVGLLSNSILQGEIIMSETNFLQLFPEVNGYQFFLFGSQKRWDTQPLDDRTLRIIHDLLGDYGFQGEPTADRLRKLFAVQNTYLKTFQSLGGIGLLLGIFGLAVIQTRNVLERRKELALLQAIGFTKFRTILLLLYESFTLLAWGLGLAVIASAFALLPFFFGGVQQVSAMSILQQFVILVGGLLAVGIVSNVAAALAVLKIPVARELAEER
jgi:hypothetical protein